MRAGSDKWRGDQKDIELKQSRQRSKRIPKGYNADKVCHLKNTTGFLVCSLLLTDDPDLGWQTFSMKGRQ